MNLKKELDEAKQELEEVKQESIAYQILTDYKKANKRQFIVILVLLVMWFSTVGYVIYLLNDMQVVETTVTQETEQGKNSFIGNDGDIIYGETDYQDSKGN